MLKSASSQLSHPASFSKKDLWTLLLDQKGRDAKTVSDETAAHETVLLVAGSKSSGKTSLLHRFLERDDTPTPTIGLEYTYGRKSRGLHNIKDITHIWELAGGNQLSDLLEIPLNESNIHTATLFIVLDLSEPSQVVPIAEHFFAKLKSRVTTILENLEKRGSKRPKGLKAFAWKKYGGEPHPDRDLISPSPIPIVIIGNKYDVFRDFEPERRKHLTRMLRYLCHLNGATLLYVSTKDENLIMRFRHTVSHHAFRSNAPRGFSTDYNKPVFIMAGSDAFSQIVSNASDGNAELGINYMGIYEKWKAEYSSLFPSKGTCLDIIN
ncbi:hypothetical protein BKA69DRAFT_1104025 [Paraphysoderma sedebokerense]|nr:hypothetical protein BKA69DRAFT_1104025 [Paraphysoderma sedebokerense]